MGIKSGDIIGVTGKGIVSGVINLGTFGLPRVGITHVGIVSLEGPEPVLFETTTFKRPPCYYQGVEVRGCQAHRLEDFLDFERGKVWHYPLRRELYEHEAERLRMTLEQSLGLPYDMLGAIRSGGFVFRTLQAVLRREDVAGLFCSEWCAEALTKVGVMRTRHLGTWNPNKLCRRLVWSGVCSEPRRLLHLSSTP